MRFLEFSVFALLIIAIIGWFTCVAVVPAGSVGVMDTFGSVSNDIMQPGIHLKSPFTSVIMFSTQTQKYRDAGSPGDTDVATITAISNEGLTITMGIAVNYHIDPSMAPNLYKTVGRDYESIVMKPPIHSVPRDIISKYDVKTLYSSTQGGTDQAESEKNRARIEQELYTGITNGIYDQNDKSRGVIIEQVFLREIKLPDTLKNAIEAKLKMEQEISQKKFEVTKQESESDRMRAEAQGIADSNRIIAGSLTDNYLKWKWLESQSKNPNVVYVVPSDNPFPLIKDIDVTPSPKAAITS